MSVYSIDYSEPLKVGFEIPAGGFDGPGASMGSSHTSLRLYGRGALEWGEAVDEDLVRLTENFASASPPVNPASGQLWAEIKLYHYTGTPGQFRRWNFSTSSWDVTPITAVDGTNPINIPATPVVGTSYYYTLVGGVTTLYGYYPISTVGNSVNGWRARSFTVGTIPVSPEQTVQVYNAFLGGWVPPQSVTVANVQPTNPTPGTLWYDTSVGVLKVWDGVAWGAMTTTGSASTGNLNMGNYSITNVANPTNPTDALNLQTGNSLYVNAAGDTMTGSLILNADPTVALGAATKQYVDAAIAVVAGGSTATVHNNPVGTFTYAAGDIAIAGGKIYIALAANTSAVPGGDWKQVWPATYA